jgi:glycosyltransferase involved in cell wall biosynthesis
MNAPRIMIIAHGHPDLSLGGGEIAAHAHWAQLRRRGIEAMFVAWTRHTPGHAGAAFSLRSSDGLEVLFSAPPVNHFRHSQPHRRVVYEQFRALLERFRPTVVHFHHYVHLGLEMVREVHKYSAETVIALTLHEFLAICHAQGQMLKTNGVLCQKAVPLDCHACFPDITPQDFFMRELFVKSFLNLVDYFVCPSRFLLQRYAAWGLPEQRLTVLENGQPLPGAASEPLPGMRTRFVVLGQLSRLKGTLVLLDAARLLPKRLRRRIRIEVHGSVQHEVDDFKARCAKASEGLEDVVHFCGPYLPPEVTDIVRRNGWVIQPSIWWENSPMVIQEAFAAGRPVICSNIGGMAEKVEHGVAGLHFRVGSAADLAARLEQAATEPELWERLCAGVPKPPSMENSVEKLLELYALAAERKSVQHVATEQPLEAFAGSHVSVMEMSPP